MSEANKPITIWIPETNGKSKRRGMAASWLSQNGFRLAGLPAAGEVSVKRL